MLLFLVDLINIENLRISFRLVYSLSFFSFIIIRSRATSIWYHSLTSIRDQVISVCFKFLFGVFQIIGCLPNFFSPQTSPRPPPGTTHRFAEFVRRSRFSFIGIFLRFLGKRKKSAHLHRQITPTATNKKNNKFLPRNQIKLHNFSTP